MHLSSTCARLIHALPFLGMRPDTAYTDLMDRPTPPWIPVGIDGIAAELGVSENTVIAWRRRSAEWVHVAKFPESEGKISGRDWWWLPDVLDWAEKTGRRKTPPAE